MTTPDPAAPARIGRRTALALAGASVLAACSAEEDPGPPTVTASPATDPPSESPTESPSESGEPRSGPPRVIGTVASGLAVPWGIAFLPDASAIVTERDSRQVLHLGPAEENHRVRRLGVIEEAPPEGEGGLLGVAASPGFAEDRTLFFYVTTAADNRILAATLDGGRLSPTRVVLDGIPRGFTHDGGRLAFGPDGFLYASTGETGVRELAQDLGSLGGKILRITPEGRPARGNPDPDSPIWTYGHRNVQGLAFDDADRLWASEFGDSTWDELNLIERGRNYGWPIVEGRGGGGAFTNPQVVWPTSEASPSGLAWLDGYLWLGALRGQRLWRIRVDGARARDPRDFFVGEFGRLRTVAVAPDGNLWVTTSNRDGRGDPAAKDDRILLVSPGS